MLVVLATTFLALLLMGTVMLVVDSYEWMERVQRYVAILAAVMAISLVVAMLMTSWLQKSVTRPILAMTSVARQVMSQRDFSLRVAKTTILKIEAAF